MRLIIYNYKSGTIVVIDKGKTKRKSSNKIKLILKLN